MKIIFSISFLFLISPYIFAEDIWTQNDSTKKIAVEMFNNAELIGQLDPVLTSDPELSVNQDTNNLCGPVSIANAIAILKNKFFDEDGPTTDNLVREILSFARPSEILDGMDLKARKRVLEQALWTNFEAQDYQIGLVAFTNYESFSAIKERGLQEDEIAILTYAYFNKRSKKVLNGHTVLATEIGNEYTLIDPLSDKPIWERGELHDFDKIGKVNGKKEQLTSYEFKSFNRKLNIKGIRKVLASIIIFKVIKK